MGCIGGRGQEPQPTMALSQAMWSSPGMGSRSERAVVATHGRVADI